MGDAIDFHSMQAPSAICSGRGRIYEQYVLYGTVALCTDCTHGGRKASPPL